MNETHIAIQVVVLIALGTRELIGRGYRNLLLLILIAESLVLVQGQEAYVLWDLSRNDEPVRYFYGLIFRDGFTLANFCVTASILLIAATYMAASAVLRPIGGRSSSGLYQRWYSYLATIAIMAAGTLIMLYLWGGLHAFAYRTNVGLIPGLTVTLFLLQIGTIPLLHRITYAQSPLNVDWLLFIASFLLIMLNSRTVALICLFQLVVVRHYCTLSLGLNRLAQTAVIVFLVLLGWGSVRNYLGTAQTKTIATYYFGTASDGGFDLLGFFYLHNTSAFSGLAGIQSTYLRHGIDFDFGVDNLQLFTHLMPNAVRTSILGGFSQSLTDIYPYHGSVVPGGYEAAFAHFGFVGILVFSTVVGMMAARTHRRLLDPGCDRLKYTVIAGSLPLLFVFDWWGVAFFALGGLAALYIYRALLLIGAEELTL